MGRVGLIATGYLYQKCLIQIKHKVACSISFKIKKIQIFNCFGLLIWSMDNSAYNENGPPGGGTLIFSPYLGSGPASTIHPQKISGISGTAKIYLKF